MLNWFFPYQQTARTKGLTANSAIEKDRQFSVMIATHSPRRLYAKRLLADLAGIPSRWIRDIFIRWTDPRPCPNLSFFGFAQKSAVPIFILPTISGFITDRFVLPSSLGTRAILILDDDFVVSREQLEQVFVVYRAQHFGNRIIGPAIARRSCRNGTYIFHGSGFNMILTSFSFVTSQMCSVFNRADYRDARAFCVKLRNCDDILFNFVIAKHFSHGPVSFDFSTRQISTSGISRRSGHWMKRDLCCRNFRAAFGDVLQPGMVWKFKTGERGEGTVGTRD
jgi:hypothetical protein